MFKRRVANFFIDLSDDLKYDIIWTENENLIDRFIRDIEGQKVDIYFVQMLRYPKKIPFPLFDAKIRSIADFFIVFAPNSIV